MTANSWTLWRMDGRGGGWELIAESEDPGRILEQEEQQRTADPDWRYELLVCEPGTSPARTGGGE